MDLCHVSKQIKIRAENPLLGQDLKLQADVWSLKPTLKFMIWFDLIYSLFVYVLTAYVRQENYSIQTL